MSALGCYAASVVTAVTAQNTLGVSAIEPVSPPMVAAQIRTVMDDLRPDAVKVGMVADAATVDAVAETLLLYKVKHLVVDPVMVATTGGRLMRPDALDAFCRQLLPQATLLTPNLPEAEMLTGITIRSADDADLAARLLLRRGCRQLLIKGGHREDRPALCGRSAGGRIHRPCRRHAPHPWHGLHTLECHHGMVGPWIVARRGRRCGQRLCHAGPADRSRLGSGPGTGPREPFLRPRKTYHAMTPVQFITHHNARFSYLEGAVQALLGDCRWIQLRMKEASDEEFLEVGRQLVPLCRAHGARLTVEDRAHLVAPLGADGVHLGRGDMPPDEARRLLGPHALIGGTANTFADIERLCTLGVDYIGCGPFRFTATKQRLSPLLGLDGYRRLLMAAGVDGIAVSGAVLGAEHPAEEMRRMVHETICCRHNQNT